jgi:hypothetical protein
MDAPCHATFSNRSVLLRNAAVVVVQTAEVSWAFIRELPPEQGRKAKFTD